LATPFVEIEKAHRDVFHARSQIPDDGRLTGGQGRTVDFKHTIPIVRSDSGGRRIPGYRGAFDGSEYEQMKQAAG
jgi:ATP-dependent Clp protease ATP-binding subunit ClpC